MIVPSAADEFLRDFDRRIAGAEDPATLAMRLIAQRFPHYRWVGIYWLRGDELVLGPYVGAATDHVRIRSARVCAAPPSQKERSRSSPTSASDRIIWHVPSRPARKSSCSSAGAIESSDRSMRTVTRSAFSTKPTSRFCRRSAIALLPLRAVNPKNPRSRRTSSFKRPGDFGVSSHESRAVPPSRIE
jgi:hypothetical protein